MATRRLFVLVDAALFHDEGDVLEEGDVFEGVTADGDDVGGAARGWLGLTADRRWLANRETALRRVQGVTQMSIIGMERKKAGTTNWFRLLKKGRDSI